MKDTPPILLVVFNRSESVSKVLSAIRVARPARIYIASDGPRPDVEADKERVARTREVVDSGIDWPCRVEKLFHPENLGCGCAVSKAITWFFDQEPEGIILEDDCVPDPSFFPFCSQLLERYRETASIWSVSGDNFHRGRIQYEASYCVSKYFHCWGWASWRRAWDHYPKDFRSYYRDVDLRTLRQLSDGNRLFHPYWRMVASLCADSVYDTWDYAFLLKSFVEKALHLHPSVNLVRNIGFDEDATHRHGRVKYPRSSAMTFPLRHPSSLERNRPADALTDTGHFGIDLKGVIKMRVSSLAKAVLRKNRQTQ